jgi:hypothetical protein
MDMSSPASVESWIDGLELDNTLIVGVEPATEEGIDVDSIGRALHAAVASVRASGVGAPDLHEGVGEGLAGRAVDDADIEGEGGATEKIICTVNIAQTVESHVGLLLILTEVIAKELVPDIVGAFGNLGMEDAGGLDKEGVGQH